MPDEPAVFISYRRSDAGGHARHLHEYLSKRFGDDRVDGVAFLRQLIWREFSYHLLYHFPKLPEHPMRAEFERVRWREAPDDLAAWQRGRTDYPIVDAGMRELWATGGCTTGCA